ncbi:MAG: hypothetical protein AAF267_15120, partial [Deinococcota bacterium]
ILLWFIVPSNLILLVLGTALHGFYMEQAFYKKELFGSVAKSGWFISMLYSLANILLVVSLVFVDELAIIGYTGFNFIATFESRLALAGLIWPTWTFVLSVAALEAKPIRQANA